MSYGANFPDLFRRAADFVDKILRGTKPADIPVEQPTKFDLVINLTTAKALGLKCRVVARPRRRSDRVKPKHPAYSPRRRTVRTAGRNISVSLEDAFWNALKEIAVLKIHPAKSSLR